MTTGTAQEYEHCDTIEASVGAGRLIVPALLAALNESIDGGYRVRRVADVGGGTGAWLRTFVELGIHDVWLVDDAAVEGMLLIEARRFQAADLSVAVPTIAKCDLVLCLECAEHLPEARAEELVRRLTDAAPVVLFSAAIPGQPGRGHVHCRWPAYWRSRFQERGFACFDIVRPLFWTDRRLPVWYRQNCFVYSSLPLHPPVRCASVPLDFVVIQESIAERLLRPTLRDVAKRLLPAAADAVRFRLARLTGRILPE